MKNSIEKTITSDFDEISSYYVNGESEKLTKAQQDILCRWRSAEEILRKFPRKLTAARKLRARYPDISERQALIDIDNSCKFWNIHQRIDKEFINRWFIEKLMSEIAKKSTNQNARAKNLATLGRYLENMPEDLINPKYMEHNSTYIQVVINNNTVNLSEDDLINFPPKVREKFLHIMTSKSEITEIEAEEILNT